jgi:holo-[acyl-carrier protein] synthase
MAARFAAKEAVLKAFGTGLGHDMRWTDIEVVNENSGRPRVHLHGEVARWASAHGLVDPATTLALSLSHTDQFAIAQVVAVWQDGRVSISDAPHPEEQSSAFPSD